MGLLQKAVETYDCHKNLVGVYRPEHTVLAPIYHTTVSANIEITINTNGNFISAAEVDKSEPKIIIPVSEKSAGRSGTTVCAHPLSDQLCYVSPYNKEKFKNYKEKLSSWCNSEYSAPKAEAVLKYIEKGSILKDLQTAGLIKLSADGRPENEKLMVCWRVIGNDSGDDDACWLDTCLFDSYIKYYSKLQDSGEKDLCMISGEFAAPAVNTPKNIISGSANAKLVSSNDTSGFTYLGRFTSSSQALYISSEASQKAHNALRWLAAEQGAKAVFGGRTFLCWNPHGRKVQSVTGAFAMFAKPQLKPSDYRKELQNTLNGCRSELPANEDVVIAAFDAATNGRLSLTYYNELIGSDFLQRLYDWDLHCCWPAGKFGIQSPPLWQIVNCSFGTQTIEKGREIFKTDERIMRQQIQRLVSCRIDKSLMPADILKAITQRCSRLQLYEKNFVKCCLAQPVPL